MRVLIVGGGGREHALCAAIAASPKLTRLYCAPGNPGIAEVAECVDVSAEDVEGLARFAKSAAVDLTVVGPEAPLVGGLADRFEREGLLVFGPKRAAARLEGSKAYTKEICRRHHVPCASGRVFDDADAAIERCRAIDDYPIVVKADGLAAGKGVVVARDRAEAEQAVRAAMVQRRFGEAGSRVVVEEFLRGVEASVIAVVGDRVFTVLETARDHKAAFDGDRGPNTGGMGAVSPSPRMTAETLRDVETKILLPVVHAMMREAGGYRGFLYAGLMLTPGGPKLLEFNVRMGDPEAQAILPRLKSDLLEIVHAAARGRLSELAPPQWDSRPSCCVVLASGGYPGAYETGFPIEGLDEVRALPDVHVFHAGTSLRQGRLVTGGGRVLSVTALGESATAARRRAYDAVERLRFQDAHYRTDIGALDSGGTS